MQQPAGVQVEGLDQGAPRIAVVGLGYVGLLRDGSFDGIDIEAQQFTFL